MTDELLESAWRVQLLDVIGRYAHCMDDGSFDELESLFADDATFDITPDPGIVKVPITGRRAIRDALEARYRDVTRVAQRRHIMSTTIFNDVSATTAAARTFLTVVSTSKADGSLTLHGSGIYHDRFVRDGSRWVFSERLLYVDTLST